MIQGLIGLVTGGGLNIWSLKVMISGSSVV